MAPPKRIIPSTITSAAPPISMPRCSRADIAPEPENFSAAFFAVTASVASAETVIAVPTAMAKTDSTPPATSPFSIAKVSTISAPEQGRSPTAATAAQADRQFIGPANIFGFTRSAACGTRWIRRRLHG